MHPSSASNAKQLNARIDGCDVELQCLSEPEQFVNNEEDDVGRQEQIFRQVVSFAHAHGVVLGQISLAEWQLPSLLLFLAALSRGRHDRLGPLLPPIALFDL
jgi:hypothetical protein